MAIVILLWLTDLNHFDCACFFIAIFKIGESSDSNIGAIFACASLTVFQCEASMEQDEKVLYQCPCKETLNVLAKNTY